MVAPTFAILPKAAPAASSFETFAPTREATFAIGPEMLSIMFMMRDSLNTDSKLISLFLPPSMGREAAQEGKTARRHSLENTSATARATMPSSSSWTTRAFAT